MKHPNWWRYAVLLTGLLVISRILSGPVLLGEPNRTPDPSVGAQDEASSFTDELIQNMKNYQKDVEDIRGKKFKTDVPLQIQSEEDFRKFVIKSLDDELPPDKAQVLQSTWAKLGLIPKNYDLRKGFENLVTSQAAGYYDDKSKKMYLLKTDAMSPDHIKVSLIHELCHALQDQYFDLATLMKNAGATSEDAGMAVRYLVEGEATYVMTYYTIKPMLGKLPDNININQLLSQQMSRMKFFSRDELMNQSQAQFAPMLEQYPAMKSVIDGLKDTPTYLFWYLNAPYMHGVASIAEMMQLPVSTKKDEFVTGWTTIDIAYKTPPASSEQMIHPNKLLVEKDVPAVVNQPALPAGWESVYSNTLGEFGFWVLYEIFETAKSRDYSEGWDGDRYTLIKNKKDGHLGLHLSTVWDSEGDAKESFRAYMKVVGKKYDGWKKNKPEASSAPDEDSTTATWTSPDNKFATIIFMDGIKWTAVEDIPVEEIALWKKTTPAKKD